MRQNTSNMSNIILGIWAALFLAFRPDDTPGLLLGANLCIAVYCAYAFLSTLQDRAKARYWLPEWGVDDLIAIAGMAITVSSVWNGKIEIPKEANLVGWAIVATALAAYGLWVLIKESTREEKRRDWEERMKTKYKI